MHFYTHPTPIPEADTQKVSPSLKNRWIEWVTDTENHVEANTERLTSIPSKHAPKLSCFLL